jgi:hypothetical protein
MERWTITEPFAGKFRRRINFGGRPFWCMFDYSVSPAPEHGGVEITLADESDATSAQWFPWIRQGMVRGLDTARQHGREFVGVCVIVRKVYTHPVDSTERGCESYGFAFVIDELGHRVARVREPRVD